MYCIVLFFSYLCPVNQKKYKMKNAIKVHSELNKKELGVMNLSKTDQTTHCKTGKVFCSADFWNIQRYSKTSFSRRKFL